MVASICVVRLNIVQRYSGQWQGEIRPYVTGRVVNDEWIDLKLAVTRRSTGGGIGLIFFVRHARSDKSEFTMVQGIDEIDTIKTKLPLFNSSFVVNVKSECMFIKIKDGDWENASSVSSEPLNCRLVTPSSNKSTLRVLTHLPLTGSSVLVTWEGELTKLD